MSHMKKSYLLIFLGKAKTDICVGVSITKDNNMAYHYQCANCYCTLSMDSSEANEPMYSVVNGELCSSCQAEEDSYYEDDD